MAPSCSRRSTLAGEVVVEQPGDHPYAGVGVLGHQRDLQVDRLVVGHREHRIGPADAGDLLGRGVGGRRDDHRDLELAGPQHADRVLAAFDRDHGYPAGLEPGRHRGAHPTEPADHDVVPGLAADATGDRGQPGGDQQVDDQRGEAGGQHQAEQLDDHGAETEAEGQPAQVPVPGGGRRGQGQVERGQPVAAAQVEVQGAQHDQDHQARGRPTGPAGRRSSAAPPAGRWSGRHSWPCPPARCPAPDRRSRAAAPPRSRTAGCHRSRRAALRRPGPGAPRPPSGHRSRTSGCPRWPARRPRTRAPPAPPAESSVQFPTSSVSRLPSWGLVISITMRTPGRELVDHQGHPQRLDVVVTEDHGGLGPFDPGHPQLGLTDMVGDQQLPPERLDLRGHRTDGPARRHDHQLLAAAGQLLDQPDGRGVRPHHHHMVAQGSGGVARRHGSHGRPTAAPRDWLRTAQNRAGSAYSPHSARSASQISPRVASTRAAASIGSIRFASVRAAATSSASAAWTAAASRPPAARPAPRTAPAPPRG